VFPHGFIFRVIILLNLVEPSSLVAHDSVLLVENLDGMCLVGQIRFQWDGTFDNNIGRRFQTFLSWETWNTLCTLDSFNGSST
jgi:hypothetical protein